MAVQLRLRFFNVLPGIVLAIGWSCSGFAAPAVFPQSQQEYWAQFDRRDWAAAIASAEALVTRARAATPSDPQQLADALTLLGNAQLGSKNPVAAEIAYREALANVEPRVGATSEKLLDPLRGLGYSLAAQGKHSQAIPLLDRALTVSRRSFGLFDQSQQGLLRQLAGSLTSTDDATEAEKHILYLLLIGERAYGANDPRMVPVFCTVADWYAQIGSMGRAREIYRTALELAEAKVGKTSLATIEPLRSIASSYRRELNLLTAGMLRQPEYESAGFVDANARDGRTITAQFLNSEGEKALLRALKTLDATPNRPTQLLIDTLVDLGDWYQTRSQPQKALVHYRRAVTLVSPSDAISPFAFPVQVYFPTPMLATRNRYRPDSEINERFVQVEFTVTNDGAVKDAHVIDKDGSARQISETIDAIEAARYRPKFVSGEPVETTALSFRQTFRQRKEKEGETDKDKDS